MVQLVEHVADKYGFGSLNSASVYLPAENAFTPCPTLSFLGLLTPKKPEDSHSCLVSFANPPLNLASKSKKFLPKVLKDESLQVIHLFILMHTNECKPNSYILLTVPFAGLRDFVLVKYCT